jgi:ABC-type polar amino acid transport system ATPase subunit
MLDGRALCKSYGRSRILQDIDITVAPGEITVLIGPSGSGKTTLLRVLSLLDPPDSGTIRIDDMQHHFPTPPGAKIRDPWPSLTVVFQQLFLWPHLRLRENITLPMANRWQEDSERRLNELIEIFDMNDFIDRYPNETSLGQRQRVALARALLLNPSYILLDEITSALDVQNVSIILGHLRRLRDTGIGILLVTHLIGFAIRTADRVVFLGGGKVVESGGADILTKPRTESLSQFISVVESAT